VHFKQNCAGTLQSTAVPYEAQLSRCLAALPCTTLHCDDCTLGKPFHFQTWVIALAVNLLESSTVQ
jgi:hypothetical protein